MKIITELIWRLSKISALLQWSLHRHQQPFSAAAWDEASTVQHWDWRMSPNLTNTLHLRPTPRHHHHHPQPTMCTPPSRILIQAAGQSLRSCLRVLLLFHLLSSLSPNANSDKFNLLCIRCKLLLWVCTKWPGAGRGVWNGRAAAGSNSDGGSGVCPAARLVHGSHLRWCWSKV